jgi:hypothetical protein
MMDSLKKLFGFGPGPAADPASPTDPGAPAPVKPTSSAAGPPPAATLRDQLLRFIIGKLRAYQNEPDTAPTGVRLAIAPGDAEEEALYRVALWATQPEKFKKELNRQLADNYITLPANWRFEYSFYPEALPECTYREGNMGIIVLDQSKPDGAPIFARVSALVGQTEIPVYELNPNQKMQFCIGRGLMTQTSSGRVRTNDIVILNDDDAGFDQVKGADNAAVSRAHASIRYDANQRRYALLVDHGGLPSSGNKTKLIHPDDRIERADIPGMSYPLQHGDQIELGGAVTLLFELVEADLPGI